MLKTANAGENHGDPILIASINNLLIPNRSARLNYSRNTGVSEGINTVSKWKKGIRGQHTTLNLPPPFL